MKSCALFVCAALLLVTPLSANEPIDLASELIPILSELKLASTLLQEGLTESREGLAEVRQGLSTSTEQLDDLKTFFGEYREIQNLRVEILESQVRRMKWVVAGATTVAIASVGWSIYRSIKEALDERP